MEIIIHGKHNAGSHNLTAGIDRDFAEKIVDDFFQQSGSIKFGNCLITDARFWKGKWYFTYTYFVNSNLRGVGQDARATFFALTIVEQSRYYYLVSEIYTKLKEIYNTYIAGRYIRDGQYIVQDFADTQLFNGLTIQLNGLVNLTEPVDAGFKQCADLKFDERYNIVDCDAKAFVQSLRESGRVVVS